MEPGTWLDEAPRHLAQHPCGRAPFYLRDGYEVMKTSMVFEKKLP